MDKDPLAMTALYDQLRRAAQMAMGNERAGHTLSATALVHEAYLKLEKGAYPTPAAYYVAATAAMRHILIDHARARAAEKRGGGKADLRFEISDLKEGERRSGRRISLDLATQALQLAAENKNEEILILDEALSRLEEHDPQCAQVVRLRFFAGLGNAETAEALGISAATVKRNWQYARAFLYRLLKDES